MKTLDEINNRLSLGYGSVKILTSEIGYICYRVGTGENVEILFIEVNEPNNDLGAILILEMVKALENNPPYNSVFVFRRRVNEIAGAFYRKLGFTETVIPGLYKDEDAVLGTVSFKKLKERVYEITGQ